MEANINNSTISDEAKLYRFVDVTNSSISKKCIVGDFSRITNSVLSNYVRIDRYNLIYHSKIGAYSYTGPNDMIMHSQIGKFCSISWGITIGPGNHNYNRISSHDFLYNNFYNIKDKNNDDEYDRFGDECIIGNDVWIGANSTILRGVEISDGAVIGANTIVTKDIPPYAIVFGNPAKIVKYRFNETTIDKLLKIKWWNFPINKIKEKYSAFCNKNIDEAIDNLMK